MQTDNSSQCQLFQLHIDAFLDDELEPARSAELQAHTARCEACRRELAYAQRLHQAVISLPILDCSEAALEPVDRLFRGGTDTDDKLDYEPGKRTAGEKPGFWESLGILLQAIPGPVRVAVPVAAVVLLTIGLSRTLLVPDAGPEVAAQPTAREAQQPYTQAEIVQALQDLELALDYLDRISERTEVMIEDRFLRRPIRNSINASLSTGSAEEDRDADSNGPI